MATYTHRMPLPVPETRPSSATVWGARRVPRTLAVVVPAFLTLLVGLTHPVSLTPATAEWWRDLHIVLLPVFPLIGVAPWIASRGAAAGFRLIAGLGGFLFAVYYTALDALAGIAAGSVELAGHPEAKHSLYVLADIFGPIGALGLAAAWAAATLGLVRLTGGRAIVGLLAVVGALLVLKSHVYFPVGTLGLALLIAGGAVVALLPRPIGARASGPALS